MIHQKYISKIIEHTKIYFRVVLGDAGADSEKGGMAI
jgi:hypothetical protein